MTMSPCLAVTMTGPWGKPAASAVGSPWTPRFKTLVKVRASVGTRTGVDVEGRPRAPGKAVRAPMLLECPVRARVYGQVPREGTVHVLQDDPHERVEVVDFAH